MSSRSAWTGSISFGVVGMNVSAYKGTKDADEIKFNQLHADCGGNLGRKEYCKKCGKVWGEEDKGNGSILKGYEVSKGNYVTFTDEEIKNIAIESDKQIKIKCFVPEDSLDIRMFGDFYYLRQDGQGNQLSLLKKAMEVKNVIAIAQVCMRKREWLVAVRPMKDYILLQLLNYPEDMLQPENFVETAVTEKELTMAETLVGMMSEDLDLSSFKNRYQEALSSLVKSRVDGTATPTFEVTTHVGSDNTIDALERSIQELSKAKESSKGKKKDFDPEDINAVGSKSK